MSHDHKPRSLLGFVIPAHLRITASERKMHTGELLMSVWLSPPINSGERRNTPMILDAPPADNWDAAFSDLVRGAIAVGISVCILFADDTDGLEFFKAVLHDRRQGQHVAVGGVAA